MIKDGLPCEHLPCPDFAKNKYGVMASTLDLKTSVFLVFFWFHISLYYIFSSFSFSLEIVVALATC